MNLNMSQGCGRELFEKGFLLVECCDAELMIPKQSPSGSCGLGQTSKRDTNVAKLDLSNGDKKCIQDLICITKNWFDHGMMRELFTLVVQERHLEESGGNREIVRLGHSLSLRASRKASLGVSNKEVTVEGIQSCGGEHHTAYSLCGVENFIVRLPLRVSTPFPWPVTMPHMEQAVTEAFHILEDISWVFFREACEEAMGRFSVQRRVDSTNFLKDTFGAVCANGKSTGIPAKTDGDSYTSSILFLRNYIGKKPTAEAHTDSGIVTLIPFYAMSDIEGLELFTNEEGSQGSGLSKEWVAASTCFPNPRESHSLKFVVLIGEMGEAMLRSLLPSEANSHIHSIAALHRVDSKSALSPHVERTRRITTPFQLRIPFENVPGFVGFDKSSAKMITL